MIQIQIYFILPQNTLLPDYKQMLIMKDQVYNQSMIVLLTYFFMLCSVSYVMQVPGCNPDYESGKLYQRF